MTRAGTRNKKLKKKNPKVGKLRVKKFIKNEYIAYWKECLRNSLVSASYAMHKMDYNFEHYLDAIAIKKHRNSLAKLRLSDHSLHIHTGHQTRPRTPPTQRFCKNCPDMIEDEAHFLFECTNDSDIKSDFLDVLSTTYPDFAEITNKQMKYKFIMSIRDSDSLISLGYLVNLLFKNRDQPIT